MTFPVVFHIFGLHLPSHQVMELLGYTAGFQTFLWINRRFEKSRAIPADAIGGFTAEKLCWIIVAAVCGAAVGSKILAIIESFPSYWAARSDPRIWLEGKTIVGGLLGGWIAVELAKKIMRVRGSSSEGYGPGLCVGIAIGRIGCFLTGLPDRTYGIASSLPWAVDFGDGVRRHPTQLYESIFAIVMFVVLIMRLRKPRKPGEIFRLFMLMYLGFRFLIEFIKPVYPPYLGLSAIQVACLIGCSVAGIQLMQMNSRRVGFSPPENAVG